MEGGGVSAETVRQMLGLSDRGAMRELMGLMLAADAPGALAALRRQYDYGVDPQSVLRALHRLWIDRSEEHTSELQSLMRISYAVFCLKKKKKSVNITLYCSRRTHIIGAIANN